MGKKKTHKGASKRFKRTKSGKLMHRVSGYYHKLVKKTGKAKRQARQDKSLPAAQAKTIKRMIDS
ncbi:50S ribosomal protein L35 [Candidatus Bipolaricaulota bacterium]|nr:50S ribosomal protein L35 [Candidatus Bipolaricaulota bacterium]HBR10398.1 50S ribosomal protein L35 [Candidatus Acetothermia bacterium]